MVKLRKTSVESVKKSQLLQLDVKLARTLAGNDKKAREKVLKNLRKWFDERSQRMPFTETDFLRIWKGLFYSMWMADKPLCQEENAENIAKLILHFKDGKMALLFFKCSLTVLTTEWFGIDQLRLDKFLMFVRRILRQGFMVLQRFKWKSKLIEEFADILLETVLKKDSSKHLSLTMHITEIYLEELAKVSNGQIEKHTVAQFILPFIKQLSSLTDSRQISHMHKFLFHHLMNQTDEGIEYNIKFEAWKESGFAGGSIDALEKVVAEGDEENSDEEPYDLNKPLDPRAGKVDVELPQLPFDPKEISKLLLNHKFAEGSTAKTRKILTKLAEDFDKLGQGIFPLGLKQLPQRQDDGYSMAMKKSVNRLVKFEKELLRDSSKNRKRKLRERKAASKRQKTDSSSLAGVFQDKLQEFIAKSEGGLINGIPKRNKALSRRKDGKKDTNWKLDCHFRRNSGTWIVYRRKDSQSSPSGFVEEPFDSSIDLNSSNDSIVVTRSKGKKLQQKVTSPEQSKLASPAKVSAGTKGSPGTSKKSPVKGAKEQHLFPASEWDSPPQEGEVEIFVASNKFKNKIKKVAQEGGKDVNEVLNDSIKKLARTRYSLDKIERKFSGRRLRRQSLDPKLIKNPFAKTSTPGSQKKVKINLKLNTSQEVHEHHQQLRSSPAIPFSADKKPSKPLLKPNSVRSPINPFYRKKLLL